MAETARLEDNMVSFPSLDLFLLTFNCAKTAIDVPVFSAHLEQALVDRGVNSSVLPDLVVFSLQEFAPLGHAFIGSYFVTPYITRFEQALTDAATRVDKSFQPYESEEEADGESEAAGPSTVSTGTSTAVSTAVQAKTAKQPKQPKQPKPYHLIREAHVGMTAVLLFARDPATVHNVQVAECGFGVADMANKGAVGVRVAYGRDEASAQELTFVATHLAAMEWNLRRRNANWRSIVAGLTFGNPKEVVAASSVTATPSTNAAGSTGIGRGRQGRTRDEAASAPRTEEEEAEEAAAHAAEDDWLLQADGDRDGQQREEAQRLQAMSVFRPNSLLFLAGDLNYRISSTSPPPEAAFPDPQTWQAFLSRDQLTQERQAGRTLHGLQEAPIRFRPTYKYDLLDATDADELKTATNADEVRAYPADAPRELAPLAWKYAGHRWPSWCDRVLFQDVPAWTKRRWQEENGKNTEIPQVQVLAYNSLPLMVTSDHQPVYFRAKVPLVDDSEPDDAVQGGEAVSQQVDGTREIGSSSSSSNSRSVTASGPESGSSLVDPRIRLPVPIDTDAWDRRAAARRREWLAGSGMLVFNTPTGAVAMMTAVLAVVGAYWLYTGGAQP